MHQLIIGMPNSGKSTFIAALRHLLIANEVPTELELTELADNEAHLNQLESEWLACKRVERTKPSTEGWVQFCVQNQKSGVQTTLSIPDLRGEVFEQPACIGQCHKDLHDALSDTDGVLLFTNADRGDDALLISDFIDILGDDVAESPQPTLGFKPENMPEEVKIVEFLQFVNRRPRRVRKRSIAILISAWDVVESLSDLTPDKWLETFRPMLSQFLTSNSDVWDMRVYGISAQGGRLPEMQAALEKISCPSKRVRVVGHGAQEHDLSAPLLWLMSEND